MKYVMPRRALLKATISAPIAGAIVASTAGPCLHEMDFRLDVCRRCGKTAVRLFTEHADAHAAFVDSKYTGGF